VGGCTGNQRQLHRRGEWKLTLDVFRDMGLAFIAR